MDPKLMAEQLRLNSARIRALVEGVDSEQARWKPDPLSWSILEVTQHLYDEEREDFRAHLKFILEGGGEWPSIDPPGWVVARSYNQRQIGDSLRSFLAERETSLAWLDGLAVADWDVSVPAPWGGQISAGDMLSSWVAHDQLHMRQLVELHRLHLIQSASPYRVAYAGPW